MLADLVIITKSASQENCWQKWEESAGRFGDCHQICQSAILLEEIRCLGKSVGDISDCFPISQSGNLLTGREGKSAGRFSDCFQIFKSGNLLAEMGQG